MSSSTQQIHNTISSNIRIEAVRDLAAWDALAPEWNALLAESHNNVPFLTYEFQRAWWSHLGGAEWQAAELNILVGRDASGALIGIAPLFRAPVDGQPTLQLIGAQWIADYLDLIVRPQHHEAFTRDLLVHLNGGRERIELYNVLDSSPTVTYLKTHAAAAGFAFGEEMLQPSPYLPLPGSLDAYIDSLGSKQAHELRRKMRRAQRNAEPISFEFIDEKNFDAALEDFFQLMVKETNKAEFLHPAMRAQMEAIARGMRAAGWLQLVF